MSNGAAEEAVCCDRGRRTAAASCWKAALLNHPLLLHLAYNICASQHQTRTILSLSLSLSLSVYLCVHFILFLNFSWLIGPGSTRTEKEGDRE